MEYFITVPTYTIGVRRADPVAMVVIPRWCTEFAEKALSKMKELFCKPGTPLEMSTIAKESALL